MSSLNDLKEQHLDQFFDWLMDKKYEDAMDWCCDTAFHPDDDHEEIIETYAEENSEALWKEYFDSLPEFVPTYQDEDDLANHLNK